MLNADVLSEIHPPDEIHSRESHLKEISVSLWPITQSRTPMNCWLHGKPGVGKTATALWILRKLEKEASVRTVYVNCWEDPTFFSVLDRIANELRMLGAERLSKSFKLERLKRHLSNERLVIVLDEIDQAPPKERHAMLYNLTGLPMVGLICVCNTQHVYFDLEERIKSRLNPVQILFEEYSSDELLQVLNQRAQHALAPDTCTEELLQTIANLANGDARIAIQTLKNAAHMAEKDGNEEIQASHIRRAWNAAKDMERTHLLRNLTDHHHLLYELIAKKRKVLSGDLWRMYLKTCDKRNIKPIAVRTYSDYCNELVDLRLVQTKRAAIQGKVREFRALD